MSPISTLAVIEAQTRRRIDTDRILSISTYILWTIVLLFFTFVGGIIVVFVANFRLLQRRNDHFERQARLFEQVLVGLRDSESGSSPTLDGADALVRDLRTHWTPREPWIWAVVLPILTLGIAGLWLNYWLTVDWRRHSKTQSELVDAVSTTFRERDQRPVAIVDGGITPERNYWLYLALTILTAGLFGFYWWYILFKDGNDHMRSDAFMEDQLLNLLRS